MQTLKYMVLFLSVLTVTHQGLVLRPSCVPEKVGVHKKGVSQK
jgi:hypothetical protein